MRCANASSQHGLRNSLLIAIAPTATIASIAGCYECIEPQVSNLFKRETLSGDFLQVNATCRRAEDARPVDAEIRDAIKLAEGSIQGIPAIPEEPARDLPHRVGAAAEGADRTGRRARRPSSTRASR
jgi:ribonucleotide reductase alpha subunit